MVVSCWFDPREGTPFSLPFFLEISSHPPPPDFAKNFLSQFLLEPVSSLPSPLPPMRCVQNGPGSHGIDSESCPLPRTTKERPFNVLGLQQVAIGGLNKAALSRLYVDVLGLEKHGSYRSEKVPSAQCDVMYRLSGGTQETPLGLPAAFFKLSGFTDLCTDVLCLFFFLIQCMRASIISPPPTPPKSQGITGKKNFD